MRLRPVLSAVATGAAALGLLLPSSAAANPVTCNVNASAGYVNCLTFTNPSVERVQALHTTGLRYRFQLQRASPAATWGWWEYNDLDTHIIPSPPPETSPHKSTTAAAPTPPPTRSAWDRCLRIRWNRSTPPRVSETRTVSFIQVFAPAPAGR